ncbi:MAG: phenylalanine--tRNA ligase subunit beta [Thermodesulfovibrionales bacterium]|nr:phenylalanine--tRNA ligase subunit beta [Thermodesulfovibrionales bacterium]
MKVSFEWLKELINIKDSADEVAHRLTMIGLEVEAMEQVNDDIVFEVNVTPNRPDCLSIVGIARELSAAYGVAYELPAHDIAAETGELNFNVDILDKELCNRYAGRIVRNVKICESPEWLKKRLEKCNIRPINNVVDATNYVLLEFGHPLHAFDLKTIKGNCIRIGTCRTVKGQAAKIKFKTLDGIEREMPDDSLLIWDAERPIAIAGIMGGIETEVSDYTTDIFIESAYFEPTNIRRTSKSIDLKTESSYRFERGTDIKMLKKALDRAAYLMKETADGEIYGKIDIYPKRYIPPKIQVRYERVNRVLGLKLAKKEILACINKLGLDIEEVDANTFKAKPPTYRRDLKRDADIIEEITRFYGYDRIPAELPKATIGIDSQESRVRGQESKIKNNIKESFLRSGFTEVINYSFMDAKDLDILNIAADDERRCLVDIRNPLRAEDAHMRTTLIPALIKNVIYNLSHGNRELRFFETGRVFINISQDKNSGLPLEKEHVGIIYYHEKSRTLYKDETQVFYIVKGIIEAIFNDLKIYDYSFKRSSEPFLHPGQSADIFIGDNKIGYAGIMSPAIVDILDIKAHRPFIAIAEIDIDRLVPYAMQVVQYRSLPKYPHIERDTALLVDVSLEASALMKWLRSYSSELIDDISIFDVYQGKNIPEGKKSIAFNVRYRASDRTLNDDEIDVVHKSLVAYISEKTKGQLRSS